MDTSALQHLVRAASALAEDRRIFVLGSASFLASYPSLGEPGGALASTFDADLCPDPFEESVGKVLDEAMGEAREFHRLHGYHADVLNDSVYQTLPVGWRDRLVPVSGCPQAFALDPHDAAAVKLLVGPRKDLDLVRSLGRAGLLDPGVIRARLRSIAMDDPQTARAARSFEEAFGSGG